MRATFDAAKQAYNGRFRLLDMGSSPLHGIRLLPAPGHTPGHVLVRISSLEDVLIVTGDAILTQVSSLFLRVS